MSSVSKLSIEHWDISTLSFEGELIGENWKRKLRHGYLLFF